MIQVINSNSGRPVTQTSTRPVTQTQRNTDPNTTTNTDVVVGKNRSEEEIEDMAIDAKCHVSVIRDLLGRGIAKEEIAKAIAYVVQSQPKNPGGLLRSGKLFDENGRCIYVSDEAHYQRLLEKRNAELQAEEQVKAHWDIALAWYQGMQEQQQAEIRAMLNAWVKDTIWYRVPELRKRPWEIPGAKAQLVNMYLEYGNSRKK